MEVAKRFCQYRNHFEVMASFARAAMFVLILNHARYPANPRLIPRARAQASHGNITVLSLLNSGASVDAEDTCDKSPPEKHHERSEFQQIQKLKKENERLKNAYSKE